MSKREQDLLQALRDVVDPITMFKRKVEAEGGRLSEMAYSISRDPGFLQSIAQGAIHAYEQSTRKKLKE